MVRTRFPPEPNGYLHIGHAKSIALNSGLAAEYGGTFNLRFDDTNPAKEEQEFVDSITADVRWLVPGFDAEPLYASDLFEQMYAFAEDLVSKGLAYVDDQTPEQIRETRGTLTEPGSPSPFRDRAPAENLDLLRKMRDGAFPAGSRVLRAKIDMASTNLNLRDPVMYRIVHAHHHRSGDRWHIYPMYDWAHGLEDSAEGITHSICTLEFEAHRPLYDWFIDAINTGRAEPIHHPQQIEFARLNPTYVVTSKRKLKELVDDRHVQGWDDPRMPTVSALRRRGYTPEAVRAFVMGMGVTKFNASHDFGLLENALRDDLNLRAPRRTAVLDPLLVTVTTWDEGETDHLEAVNNPNDPSAGSRTVPFTRRLYIEREDFMEDAPKKFFRLKPGGEVRLRYAYWIRCDEVVKDDAGNVIELRCSHDPATRGGDNPPPDADGNVRKVKGTMHWVSADHAVDAEVRLFDRLYSVPQPGKASGNHLDDLNPDSLKVLTGCKVEPALAGPPTPDEPAWPDGVRRFQFERLGYFCHDRDSTPQRPVFNRAVGLKDAWAKEQGKD